MLPRIGYLIGMRLRGHAAARPCSQQRPVVNRMLGIIEVVSAVQQIYE